MSPSFLQSTAIPALAETINFTEARHNVLAGNIANFDTPGYQIRDLSVETFQQRLADALKKQSGDSSSSPGIMEGEPDNPMREVRESLQHILYHDGTNLSIEHQVAEISKNQYLHNTAITILRSQFQLLQAAISEQV